MRKLKLGFVGCFFLVAINASSQFQTTGSGGSGSLGNTGLNIPGVTKPVGSTSHPSELILSARGGLKLPASPGIEGTPFLNPEYQNAYVRVRSGYTTTTPVKFNLYGNEIIFVQNGNELSLDSVDYVSFLLPQAKGGVQVIQLKTGYPAIANHDRNTIYQILDSGIDVQLLKYSYQVIEEVKSLGVTATQQFANREEYYVFTNAGGMKKIKLDKSSVLAALPEYASRLETIMNERKLKMKKEADLIELFKSLTPLKGF